MNSIHSFSRRGWMVAAGTAGIGMAGAYLCAADPAPREGMGLPDDVKIEPVKEGEKICVDQILPDFLRIQALRNAVKEDPANDILGLLDGEQLRAALREPGRTPLGLESQRAVVFYGKKWAQNRKLKVGFYSTTPQKIRDKVAHFVNEAVKGWHDYVNVEFVFGQTGPFEIRISFDPAQGSKSYIGTDNLSIPQNQATMNLGWVTETSTEDSDRAVILHEFGHALGMGHEHQSPPAAQAIVWNRPQIIADMWARAQWTPQMVDQNIISTYSSTVTQFTALDKTSIMMYPYTKAWTLNGFESPWNVKLSQTDINFMRSHYPRA